LTVTAVTQQIKPDIYSKVEDEATIIVTYPESQGIIQASWNWPVHRKDMDIYGTEGIIRQYNASEMEFMSSGKADKMIISKNEFPGDDPFNYFAAAVLHDIEINARDLSSLENNLIVVEILDAALRSAEQGETIYLK
jgi:predicted dehydrogenase